jgi:hypothetical protein
MFTHYGHTSLDHFSLLLRGGSHAHPAMQSPKGFLWTRNEIPVKFVRTQLQISHHIAGQQAQPCVFLCRKIVDDLFGAIAPGGVVRTSWTSARMKGRGRLSRSFSAPFSTSSSAPSTSSLMKSTLPISFCFSHASRLVTRTRIGEVELKTSGGRRLLQPVWLPCTTWSVASVSPLPRANPCTVTFRQRLSARCKRSALLSRGDGSNEKTRPEAPTRFEASNAYRP